MQAIFYQFAKRTNSTKRPSGGQGFGIDLKAPCNIINPEIKIATQNDPTVQLLLPSHIQPVLLG
jgi:hypothetical protein